jgi:transcription-repair coupling factor (superfamily II helicase)
MELLSLMKRAFADSGCGGCRIFNLTGSSAALFLAMTEKPFIAVEKDEAAAEMLGKDINFFRRMFSGRQVFFLPESNGPETAGRRACIIHSLGESDSMVTSSRSLKSALWDKESLEGRTALIRAGVTMARSGLEELLVELGYSKAPMVGEKGEFSRREWIFDVFPSTAEDPLRIEFFGDEIEEVKIFDVETQRSKGNIDGLLLFPAAEPAELNGWQSLSGSRTFYCLYPEVEREEFPADTVLLSRYSFEGSGTGTGGEGNREAGIDVAARIFPLRGSGILPEEREGLAGLPEAVGKLAKSNRVIIVASSSGQAERLKGLFREKDIIVPLVGMEELAEFPGTFSLTVDGLSSGLFTEGLLILTATEMFGERPSFRSITKSKISNLLVSIDDITPGDFVVHRDHGVGRFSGVNKREESDGTELELMVIEYENGKLYIPVQNIRVLSKYRSEEGIVPTTDRLGGKTWQKKKEKVRKKVRELAAKLLSLYAGRRAARGFSFSPDTELHREFDSFFAYEETADQLKAIADLKRDMESDTPMDRLLCGDVGYGKTEVAMRAAFKAVYDNRQVAVLVPTTILAEQHYRTFRERFSGFPVNIDFISRFKSKKDIERVMKGVAGGEVDIVIGTHALLSGKLSFCRLGLLIIDEEHRFGVGQKERITELKTNIDVLTLTATPIPRTLHMALSGIRNISVIETPPEERLAVKSTVAVSSDSLIGDAIMNELRRDGQVFFVHNRVNDIHVVADLVKRLVPSAELGVAHGQMPERALEKVMHRFFEGEVTVLVSTSIVGSGLDIPRANTIVIDRADRMGLADLYQLRGRVGRSSRKGYAFFLAPPESMLSEQARKRLQAVQEMSYLGAGFRLALKDLEIRGAGEIFGAEQSGHIHEVGFDLYIEMLEEAVSELKGEEVKEEREPAMEVQISAFIPAEYIEDVTLRLSFYRRLASLKTAAGIADFECELRDRFGALPEEARNLLRIAGLKAVAKQLGVEKIHESGDKVRVLFFSDTSVQPSHIMDLRHGRKKRIKFLPEGFEVDCKGSVEGPLAEVDRIFGELSAAIEAHMPV